MPYNIMVIDDEKSEFERYQKVLASYTDLRLIHVKNGPDAIEEMNKTTPDLIFLDQVFYTINVGNISKMYGVDKNGGIEEHSETTNPNDILTDEKKQGLYILKRIRSQGYTIPVIFVTQYVDRAGDAINEALENGAQDYISKERITREGLIPRIEKCLSIKLSTLEEQIGNILNQHIENVPEDEKAAFINNLKKEALAHRRRRLPFIEAVIKKMPRNSPTSADLLKAVKDTNNTKEWAAEPVDRQEILRWILSKLLTKSLSLHEKEIEPFGSNALLYIFRFKDHGEYYFLKIIKPNFSLPDVVLKDESRCYSFEFNETDPEWEGSNVVTYIEKVPNANLLTVEEYANTQSPLSADKIHTILKNLADILKNLPEGHGMLDIDSIFVQDDGSVFLGDFHLWDYVTMDGHSKIEGLTLNDRKRRDIQALGRAADTLLTGHAGGLENLSNNVAFFDFMKQCKEGSWDINKEIPNPPVKTRFFHLGPFASPLEQSFFYKLKAVLFEKNIESLVFIKTRVKLPKMSPREVDALVVRHGKIWWLDVKGQQYFKKEDLSKCIHLSGVVASELKKQGINNIYVEGRVVMEQADYDSVIKTLTDAEKQSLVTVNDMLNMIANYSPQVHVPQAPFDEIVKIIKNMSLTVDKNYYEETPEFESAFSKQLSLKNRYVYDEIDTLSYHLRRYRIGYVTDSYRNIEDIESLLQETERECNLFRELNSKYILLPEKMILLSSDLRQLRWASGEGIPRWLYKCYSKPEHGWEGPFFLKDQLDRTDETARIKLAYQYLEAAISIMLNKIPCDFDRNSLMVFRRGEDLHGVLEIKKDDSTIQSRHLHLILSMCQAAKSQKLTTYEQQIAIARPIELQSELQRIIIELKGEIEENDLTILLRDINEKLPLQETLMGKVDWFDSAKGFGYIVTIIKRQETKVFVHISDIVSKISLSKGDHVEFVLTKGEKGLKAVSVKKVSQ